MSRDERGRENRQKSSQINTKIRAIRNENIKNCAYKKRNTVNRYDRTKTTTATATAATKTLTTKKYKHKLVCDHSWFYFIFFSTSCLLFNHQNIRTKQHTNTHTIGIYTAR